MKTNDALRGLGRILTGHKPVLSVEITKECPLSCPSCYAFQPEHIGGASLVSLAERRGARLVDGIFELVDRFRPLAVYLVGGEPLVRFRELNELLPRLSHKLLALRIVTSGVRPIPAEWTSIPNLDLTVSVDGLQPEHDQRRKPATYERILKHIAGHRVIVHCTVTRQMMYRDDYLEDFMSFWSQRPEVKSIHVSFFTPQMGESSEEILTPSMRRKTVEELRRLSPIFPKIRVNPRILEAFLNPPSSPRECLFARITSTVSADLRSSVEPCQFGGTPDCKQCGCLASMGMHAVAEYRLPLGVKIRPLFEGASALGSIVRRVKEGFRAH